MRKNYYYEVESSCALGNKEITLKKKQKHDVFTFENPHKENTDTLLFIIV